MFWTRSIYFLLFENIIALSFNQPRFDPNTTWEINAINFANQSIAGIEPCAIFVTLNNSIYFANQQTGEILIWENDKSINPSKMTSGNLSKPLALVVTTNGDIYADNGDKGFVKKWISANDSWISVMSVPSRCYGLTIDIYQNVYCSMATSNKVDKKWLNGTTTIVAGTGSPGATSDKLSGPCGIFVDTNQDLYVADFSNNRIQLFELNQRNGVTVAGQGSSSATINLVQPTGFAFDGDHYLFIVDHGKHRLIGSNEYGFYCIFGCSASSGPTNDKLNLPATMAFDSYGNIYVTDQYNNRIQKIVKKISYSMSTIDSTTTTENVQITSEAPSTIEKIMSTSTTLSPDQTSISEAESTTVSSDQTSISDAESTKISSVLTSISEAKPTTVSSDQTSISETGGSVSTILRTTISSTASMSTLIIKTNTTTQSNNVENCLSPQVKLIPESNTLETAYHYRRSQDFYILSTIKFQCNKSLSTKKIWKIRNYSSIGSSEIDFDKKVLKSSSELYILSNTFPYGIYELELTVEMIEDESLVDSSSVYVQINPSGVTVNLVPLGTSVVTVGHQQILTLNPGSYSIDLDGFEFNASDWNYQYFCRIYDSTESFSSIEIYLPNQFQFNGTENSSLLIHPGALQIDMKYQFLVQMSNRQNTSLVVNGYVIVEIKSGQRAMIVLGCVIESLCRSDEQFQKLNPTSQLALFSYCVHHCQNVRNVIWNIYHGQINSTNKLVQWILFDQIENWFYGRNTTDFTVTSDLFRNYSNETHWKFEVIYLFENMSSSSALNFEINQPPSNGFCQINPTIGIINTLFNITCSNWQSNENIKEYSLHTSSGQIIAFSPVSSFEVRLPIGFHLNIFVEIRDISNGITQFSFSPITVLSEPIDLSRQSFIDLLSSGNQNTISQVITLINDEFTRLENQLIEKARIPLTSISISSLGSQPNIFNRSSPVNESVQFEFLKEINHLANLREYFIQFFDELTVTSVNSFKLQSLSLVQLTSGTNQLTRASLVSASEKCYQLTHQLQQWLSKLPYEDVQIIATQLLQCASNILSAVNGPLQQRIEVLEKDFEHATEFLQDYDLELESMNTNLFVFYFQNELANELNKKIDEMISLLTSSLSVHINVGQQYTINTPQVFMSLERISTQSLLNKTIKQIENAQISFSINLSANQIVLLRSIVKPIAIYGNSRNTNLSRSLSLSILDKNGVKIHVQTSLATPIEFIIPRDPNLIIQKMTEQNITNKSMLFNYHKYYLQQNYSFHLEFHSFNQQLSYLLTYRLDSSMKTNIDGWKYFCSMKQDEIFTFFLDNSQTSNHKTIIFAIRELNTQEEKNYCRNQTSNLLIINSPMKFSSNYEIRSYLSACFYLNEQNQWQSDGLIVGPLTNHSLTHCLSTHI